VEPVLLDYLKRMEFERRLILFFLGTTRDASSVLTEQKANTERNFEVLRRMSESVLPFKMALLNGDFQSVGEMLLEGWMLKKQLASAVSNPTIDKLYQAAMDAGAWGGKMLGAGGGGCLLLMAPPEARRAVVQSLAAAASGQGLMGATEIPIGFVQTGAELLFNSNES